jgi:hypothetical protein
MYFIPICDKIKESPAEGETVVDRTTCTWISTAHFLLVKENTDGKYTGYNSEELREGVKQILQTQIFMVYQWSVIRARIEHPYSLKHLHFACTNVTPSCFVVEEDDITLYLSNPCFLWRFSTNNYSYFYSLFIKGIRKKNNLELFNIVYSDELLTYDRDFTETVPYYVTLGGTIENYIRYLVGKTTRESSKWYKIYKFTKLLNNSSGYELTEVDKCEFRYSPDYRLQLLVSNYTYEDFVRIAVTGHTMVDAGPLLKCVILQEKQIKAEIKLKKRKVRIEESRVSLNAANVSSNESALNANAVYNTMLSENEKKVETVTLNRFIGSHV